MIMIILSKQLYLQLTITKIDSLHKVIWYQVFQSNANNLETYLFDPSMGP